MAHALLRLHAARADRLAAFAALDWDKALGWLRGRTGADLAPEQADAVRLALTSRVAVLTGGPGCGKSFTVRSVVELAAAKGARIVLAAPTGRAAKRLAELTGHEAATIHRLLALRPGGEPSFDAGHPLDAFCSPVLLIIGGPAILPKGLICAAAARTWSVSAAGGPPVISLLRAGAAGF